MGLNNRRDSWQALIHLAVFTVGRPQLIWTDDRLRPTAAITVCGEAYIQQWNSYDDDDD